MRKFFTGSLLLLMLIAIALPSLAQDVTVIGRVTSSSDGTVLPGVNIQLRGTTRGTTTDGQGNYKISLPANARLVFSFIGYTNQEVAVGNKNTINISLESNDAELTEVVVIGYGAAVKKIETTGATSRVSGKDFENLPAQSFDRALQGRAAGV